MGGTCRHLPLVFLLGLHPGCGARSSLTDAPDAAPAAVPDAAPAGKTSWALSAGGAHWDQLEAMAADGQGNVYLAGYFQGTARFGAQTLQAMDKDSGALFVVKLSPAGQVLWALASDGPAWARGLALDRHGDVYVTGSSGVDGTKTTLGSVPLSAGAGNDVFVARLDPQGQVLWAVSGGGPGTDRGRALGVDAGGSIYLTGTCSGAASFGQHKLTCGAMGDAFIARLDPQGSFQWAVAGSDTVAPWPPQPGDKYVGSEAHDLAVTADGTVYVVGEFRGALSYAGDSFGSPGARALFVSSTSAAGQPRWTRAGTATEAYATGAVTDGAGGVYVTGAFSGKLSLGGELVDAQLDRKLLVARLEPDGEVSWASTHEGTKVISAGLDLAREPGGPVLLGSCAFGTSLAGFPVCQGGSFFLSRLNEQGQPLEVFSPPTAARAVATAADGRGALYVAGEFEGDVELAGQSLTSQGDRDIFVWRVR